MASRTDSMPPPFPPESFMDDVFRMSYLWRVTEPNLWHSVAYLSQLLATQVNEGGQWSHREEPATHVLLRGAQMDFRRLAGFLREVGEAGEVSTLTREEEHLCRKARKWEGKAERLASRIEKALDRWAAP